MADKQLSKNCVFVLIFILITAQKVFAGEYGVLFANTSSENERFCIVYYQEFLTFPSEVEGEYFDLIDERSVDFCDNVVPHNPDYLLLNKFVITSSQNCSLTEKARNAKEFGCKGILLVTPPGNVNYIKVNTSVAHGLNITVALISEFSVKCLMEMGTNITVQFFPTNVSFDISLLIIWLVAVFTIAVGSYWSGVVRQSLHKSELNKLPHVENGSQSPPSKSELYIEEESTLNVSPILIAFFVLCMGGMLLLLYFFFDYLVYVIIALFALASVISTCSCLNPLIQRFPCTFCRVQNCKYYSPRCWLYLRLILVLTFAISLSGTWVYLRKESYSWILQDILGVTFIINMLKSIRLPSLKICTLLLVLLFFYDIFFVFITPFLTEKGESVMVQVATGGSSKEPTDNSILNDVAKGTPSEQLPMVLRVPHFRLDYSTVCSKYSLLGFGDILVPGLLVSFCHGIDLFLNNKKVYYITTCISYGVGLIATFIGLYLMSTPQPALLYLVPATLLPIFILGKCRGELKLLWHGISTDKPQVGYEEPSNVVNSNATTLAIENNSAINPKATETVNPEPSRNPPDSLTSEGTGDSEEKLLLRK